MTLVKFKNYLNKLVATNIRKPDHEQMGMYFTVYLISPI